MSVPSGAPLPQSAPSTVPPVERRVDLGYERLYICHEGLALRRLNRFDLELKIGLRRDDDTACLADQRASLHPRARPVTLK
jgi:hypothetical protein